MITLFNLLQEPYILNLKGRKRFLNSHPSFTKKCWSPMRCPTPQHRTVYLIKSLNLNIPLSVYTKNKPGKVAFKHLLLLRTLKWSLWNEFLWKEIFIPLNISWICNHQYSRYYPSEGLRLQRQNLGAYVLVEINNYKIITEIYKRTLDRKEVRMSFLV